MVALKDIVFVLFAVSYQVFFAKYVIGGPTKGKLRLKVSFAQRCAHAEVRVMRIY